MLANIHACFFILCCILIIISNGRCRKGFMRKLHRSFTPSFGLALATPSLLLIFFIKSSLVTIKFCWPCELIPNFIT